MVSYTQDSVRFSLGRRGYTHFLLLFLSGFEQLVELVSTGQSGAVSGRLLGHLWLFLVVISDVVMLDDCCFCDFWLVERFPELILYGFTSSC